MSSGLGVGFARGCRPGFKSRSNRWFGFFSGCPGFNSPRFAKQLTGCLLPVGTLNHVSFKLLRLGCLLTSMIAKCSSTINKAITITLQLRENIFFLMPMQILEGKERVLWYFFKVAYSKNSLNRTGDSSRERREKKMMHELGHRV